MSRGRRVLVVGLGDDGGKLRDGLLRLGHLPLEVDDLASATIEFERGTPVSSLVFLTSARSERGLSAAIDRLRATADVPLDLVAVGPKPSSELHRVLQGAGIATGLWTPLTLDDLERVLRVLLPHSADD